MTDYIQAQHTSDADDREASVIAPSGSRRAISSERETAYLLKSENMKRRLLKARERSTGIPFEAARLRLGL